jgi:hypothetical protein
MSTGELNKIDGILEFFFSFMPKNRKNRNYSAEFS